MFKAVFLNTWYNPMIDLNTVYLKPFMKLANVTSCSCLYAFHVSTTSWRDVQSIGEESVSSSAVSEEQCFGCVRRSIQSLAME